MDGEGEAFPSKNGDATFELNAEASSERCLFITDVLQFDAGVMGRLVGLEARVDGLLSSEGRRGGGGAG